VCRCNTGVKAYRTIIQALTLCLAALSGRVEAQWVTQTIPLTNGWNAVYLHVDASHTTLAEMISGDVSNPILAVWRWNPASQMQFVDNPQEPLETSQWLTWSRTNSASSLQRLSGNSAYLVNVATNPVAFSWSVKGKPIAPSYEWTTTGLNFIGFPTVPTTPPDFEQFLSLAPALQANAEIYYYPGGALDTNNPTLLQSTRKFPVQRGEAFWVKAGTSFNRYFGPFSIELRGANSIEFGTNFNTFAAVIRNESAQAVTVSATLLPSEQPPAGQTNIVGVPPLLVRGAMNFTNFTYGAIPLLVNRSQSWTLTPAGQIGSEVEVVFGINRAALTNAPGDLSAGVLRFTDSLGFTAIDTAVSAVTGTTSGLWVGKAMVDHVGQYLKSYQVDGNGNPIQGSNGQYLLRALDTSVTAAPRPYPLRLIVHNADNGAASLLQRVFCGLDPGTNVIAATKQAALHPGFLKQARRISATHLPFSTQNTPWQFSGNFKSGEITTTVETEYDDHGSNPFLHTYHPDHDNLDATFQAKAPQGSESYKIQRAITLNLDPPANDFGSQVEGTRTITGDYLETVTVIGLPRAGGTNDTRQFVAEGKFTLNRISDVPTLTIVP